MRPRRGFCLPSHEHALRATTVVRAGLALALALLLGWLLHPATLELSTRRPRGIARARHAHMCAGAYPRVSSRTGAREPTNRTHPRGLARACAQAAHAQRHARICPQAECRPSSCWQIPRHRPRRTSCPWPCSTGRARPACAACQSCWHRPAAARGGARRGTHRTGCKARQSAAAHGTRRVERRRRHIQAGPSKHAHARVCASAPALEPVTAPRARPARRFRPPRARAREREPRPPAPAAHLLEAVEQPHRRHGAHRGRGHRRRRQGHERACQGGRRRVAPVARLAAQRQHERIRV